MDNYTRPARVCPVCLSHFPGIRPNKRYCCVACAASAGRTRKRTKRDNAPVVLYECPGCGANFERVGRQKFCSVRCGQRVQTRNRLGIADPGLDGTCWWCHARFSLLDGRRLYCSTECAKFVKSLWNVGKYGITRDDYREAWYRQDGKCAICRRPERTARNHLLSTDHDHVTGKFRGLLCSHCNRGTGLFGDDPARLRAAAEYIERHREASTI